MTSQIESISWTLYTPLYRKGIKKGQNMSMETTIFLSVKFATSLFTSLAGGLPFPRLNPGPSTQNGKELMLQPTVL